MGPGEILDAAKSSFGPHAVPLVETTDPLYHTCAPIGFPIAYLYPLPMQIVQTPGEVILLFEWDSLRHQIFTDGRPHDTALGPLWMGDSIGHWEGDTLVADTVNFNDKTWLDRMGHPHSDEISTSSNASGGWTTTIWSTTSPLRIPKPTPSHGPRICRSC